MAKYGIVATVDNVLITSGSQQALDLIAKLLINRGDRILVESPTYLGALQAFDLMGAEYVTVPIDGQGLQTRLLEGALRSGPKFMYVLPNFQNPGGVTLSEDRRTQLVWLSDKYGIPIIEDDPYGQLRYEGEHIKPLVVLDRDECVARQRLPLRQCHLPEHILQSAGAGAAAGMDRGSARRHHPTGATEAVR